MDHPILIGWREKVDLPYWGLFGLRAKADTGARSSAIDVAQVEELPGERVRFEVVTDRKDPEARHVLEADVVRRTRIRSSFGQAHDRLFVETRLRLAGEELVIELGLVCRKNMLSRMLLGRKTLEGRFAVDPGRRYLHKSKKRRSGPRASAG